MHNVLAIVRAWKTPEVGLDLERNAVGFEPGVDGFRREGVHGRRKKFAAAWVLCEDRADILNTGRDVTASSTRDNDFLPQSTITLQQKNFRLWSGFEYGCSGHN